MSGTISIMQALQITVICMGIVFATLIVISFLIDLMKVLLTSEFGKKSETASVGASGAVTVQQTAENAVSTVSALNGKKPEELTTEDEIAVAMVAAIEASEGNKDVKVRVLAVREV